jgi:very-short-patch-repair endonuclease
VIADESEKVTTERAERRRWLEARNYRVIDVTSADIESRMAEVLDDLAQKSATAP